MKTPEISHTSIKIEEDRKGSEIVIRQRDGGVIFSAEIDLNDRTLNSSWICGKKNEFRSIVSSVEEKVLWKKQTRKTLHGTSDRILYSFSSINKGREQAGIWVKFEDHLDAETIKKIARIASETVPEKAKLPSDFMIVLEDFTAPSL